MPSVPGTTFQLVILLTFVLPGSVFQFVRVATAGPRPDDGSALNRVLRVLGVSAFLVAVYAIAFGPRVLGLLRQAQDQHDLVFARQAAKPLGEYALVLLFLVPAGLALLRVYVLGPLWGKIIKKLPENWRPTYDPTPRAWDFAFKGISPCFVRILTKDGTWVGGYYGKSSFVSSYPEPEQIFLEAQFQMTDDGAFGLPVENTVGVLVSCHDIVDLELLNAGS